MRALRCGACGKRTAAIYERALNPGLFIFCRNCHRQLHGARYPLKAGGRHGVLIDMTKKQRKAYYDDLLKRWNNEKSNNA